MTIKNGKNPFQPGYGVIPPVLAGRNALKRDLLDRLDGIKNRECNSTAIVLMGPRGCGKTALLSWVAEKAEETKLRVLPLTSDDFTSVTALKQEFARHVRKGWLQRVVQVGVNVGGTGANVGLAAGQDPGHGHLRPEIEEFAKKAGGALVLVDEAHNMPAEVGRAFYSVCQSIGLKYPMLVVVAGTPDLKSVIGRSHATFSERIQVERIGTLSDGATRQALVEPFGDDITFDRQALEDVLAETQNYPYFIQLWGKALWRVLSESGKDHIGPGLVEEARSEFGKGRWELYSTRLRELATIGMLVPVAEMAYRIGEGGKPDSGDLIGPGLSRIRAGKARDQEDAREKLLHTGFIWDTGMDNWEYGIPSLASHVRSEAVSHLRKQLGVSGSNGESLRVLEIIVGGFRERAAAPRNMPRKNLIQRLANHGHGDRAEEHVNRFVEMGLLVPGNLPGDRFDLAAPLLTEKLLEVDNTPLTIVQDEENEIPVAGPKPW